MKAVRWGQAKHPGPNARSERKQKIYLQHLFEELGEFDNDVTHRVARSWEVLLAQIQEVEEMCCRTTWGEELKEHLNNMSATIIGMLVQKIFTDHKDHS